MAEYSVVFVRSARRELEGLPPHLADRILAKIRLLSQAPRPSGSKKLRGRSDLWRIRVGDYRVVYEIFDERKMIEISYIRHRR
ncbi:MAG: type II toxin-antitoxin system RelE/ParE family toxin [Chloroflexi bacterium]|nr:type II toxin-antitoxin system RelE/ParE family toxin [Chloroflexota bacterium]